MFWLFVLLFVGGCSALFPQPQARVDCWDAAGDAASERLEEECAGKLTSECEAWPDIKAELKESQERCE